MVFLCKQLRKSKEEAIASAGGLALTDDEKSEFEKEPEVGYTILGAAVLCN